MTAGNSKNDVICILERCSEEGVPRILLRPVPEKALHDHLGNADKTERINNNKNGYTVLVCTQRIVVATNVRAERSYTGATRQATQKIRHSSGYTIQYTLRVHRETTSFTRAVRRPTLSPPLVFFPQTSGRPGFGLTPRHSSLPPVTRYPRITFSCFLDVFWWLTD